VGALKVDESPRWLFSQKRGNDTQKPSRRTSINPLTSVTESPTRKRGERFRLGYKHKFFVKLRGGGSRGKKKKTEKQRGPKTMFLVTTIHCSKNKNKHTGGATLLLKEEVADGGKKDQLKHKKYHP